MTVDCQFKHPNHIEIDENDDELSEIVKSARSDPSRNDDCAVAYLRIVKYLFRKERFYKIDEDSYQASVHFKLNNEQFDLMSDDGVNGLNINEIDTLINEIVLQSSKYDSKLTRDAMIESYRQEIYDMVFKFLYSPTFLVTFGLTSLFIISRCIKFSKFSFSAIIVIGVIAMAVTSYLMELEECKHDLEVNEIIKLQQRDMDNNPCKSFKDENKFFYTSLYAKLFGSSEDACHKYMRNVLRPSKKFCDPLKVFTKWLASIQMSYFGSIIASFIELLQELTKSSGLFTSIIWWIVGSALLVVFILSFGKEFIKSFIPEIFKSLRSPIVQPEKNENHENITKENERLRHENRILRELSMERTLPEVKPKEKPEQPLEKIEEEEK